MGARKQREARLFLEALESRCLPSTFTTFADATLAAQSATPVTPNQPLFQTGQQVTLSNGLTLPFNGMFPLSIAANGFGSPDVATVGEQVNPETVLSGLPDSGASRPNNGPQPGIVNGMFQIPVWALRPAPIQGSGSIAPMPEMSGPVPRLPWPGNGTAPPVPVPRLPSPGTRTAPPVPVSPAPPRGGMEHISAPPEVSMNRDSAPAEPENEALKLEDEHPTQLTPTPDESPAATLRAPIPGDVAVDAPSALALLVLLYQPPPTTAAELI
jgi:hypothetical protein